MKYYFKYDAGYVNINDENLFLTNSGNWQETHDLEEKGKATVEQNENRISKMKGFAYAVFIGVGAFFWEMLNDNIERFILVAGLAALIYGLFHHFKSDFGKRYKIPLNKIESIEQQGKNDLKINFRNVNNHQDFEIIKNIEPKGFKIMKELKFITILHDEFKISKAH